MSEPKQYPRTFTSIWGMPKSGKSHLGMTWPKPMMAVEVGETGIEDLLHKFDGVDYRPIISSSLRMGLADHRTILAEFEKCLDTAIKDTVLRTLLIDSTSKLWESIGLVLTDEAFQEQQRTKRNQADWSLANNYFEQIVQKARRNRTLNIVFIHRHREKYSKMMGENGRESLQATGEYEARDYKGLENLAPLVIRTGTGNRINQRTQKPEQHFLHTIELCRYAPHLQGSQVWDMDYTKLMERVWNTSDSAE